MWSSKLGLAFSVTALACARLLGYEWTEEIRLHPSDGSQVILADTRLAIISCPLVDALEFARDPKPQTPHDREWAERDSEGWLQLWSDYAARLRAEFEQTDIYVPRRPSEVKEFLHAGLCAVTDKRTGDVQETIVVVVHHNPERRGGGSRRFRFANGPAFFGDIDWLP